MCNSEIGNRAGVLLIIKVTMKGFCGGVSGSRKVISDCVGGPGSVFCLGSLSLTFLWLQQQRLVGRAEAIDAEAADNDVFTKMAATSASAVVPSPKNCTAPDATYSPAGMMIRDILGCTV